MRHGLTQGVVYIYDSNRLPFYVGESYHQCHADSGTPPFTLTKILLIEHRRTERSYR